METCMEPFMHNVKNLPDSHIHENPLVPLGTTLSIQHTIIHLSNSLTSNLIIIILCTRPRLYRQTLHPPIRSLPETVEPKEAAPRRTHLGIWRREPRVAELRRRRVLRVPAALENDRVVVAMRI